MALKYPRFRFHTRLSIAMILLIGVAVLTLSVLLLWTVVTLIVGQYHDVGATVTKLATRNIQYGVTVPEQVVERVGDQMIVSAMLLGELVDVAENGAGKTPDEINAILERVKRRSAEVHGYPLVDAFWVTDEQGRIYLNAGETIDFQFTPDPESNPQSHAFYPLLEPGGPDYVDQDFQPQDHDRQRYKYVGVRGLDKPRIVQVGVGERLVSDIVREFSVQNILDRFYVDLDVARMMVVTADGQVLAYVSNENQLVPPDTGFPVLEAPPELAPLIAFCTDFLKHPQQFYRTKLVGSDLGVVTRIYWRESDTPLAFYIQHRTAAAGEVMQSTFRYVGIVSLVTVLAACVIIWLLSRGFSKPVEALAEGAQQIGDGNLDHRIQLETGDEFEALGNQFNSMAASLQRRMRELRTETRLRERLESELAIAASLQQALLPDRAPSVAGVEVDGWSAPAREVGGDFYDYIDFGDGKLGIAIGDATGKGLPASLLLTECWSVFRALAEDINAPAALLARTNRALARQMGDSGRFVTAFFMVIDAQRGLIRYAQAGHNPPILIRGGTGELRLLTSESGLPLGIERDCVFDEQEIALNEGDTIVLYSDGVTEALDPVDALYGDQRLRDLVAGHAGSSGSDLLDRIRADVSAHMGNREIYDDQTLVVVRFNRNGNTD